MISAVLVLGTSSQSELLLGLLRKQLPVKKPKLMSIEKKVFLKELMLKCLIN